MLPLAPCFPQDVTDAPLSHLLQAGGLVVSSALGFCLHLSVVLYLWQSPTTRAKGLLLLLPPTALAAPLWAFRAGLRFRALLWVLCAVVYGWLALS